MPIVIPNWDQRFETAQSRAAGAITWTPLRHSFAATLRMQPPEVAAAMVQVVILAAMMPDRGTFNDGGRDLTIDDISASVGIDRPLIAAAISALGAAADSDGGGPVCQEGGKEGTERKKEPSSASADARMVQAVWNGNRGRCPEARALGKDRLRLCRLMAADSGGEEALLASSAAAFAADAYNVEKQHGIETWCRHRSKWLDRGRNGTPDPMRDEWGVRPAALGPKGGR